MGAYNVVHLLTGPVKTTEYRHGFRFVQTVAKKAAADTVSVATVSSRELENMLQLAMSMRSVIRSHRTTGTSVIIVVSLYTVKTTGLLCSGCPTDVNVSAAISITVSANAVKTPGCREPRPRNSDCASVTCRIACRRSTLKNGMSKDKYESFWVCLEETDKVTHSMSTVVLVVGTFGRVPFSV